MTILSNAVHHIDLDEGGYIGDLLAPSVTTHGAAAAAGRADAPLETGEFDALAHLLSRWL